MAAARRRRGNSGGAVAAAAARERLWPAERGAAAGCGPRLAPTCAYITDNDDNTCVILTPYCAFIDSRHLPPIYIISVGAIVIVEMIF